MTPWVERETGNMTNSRTSWSAVLLVVLGCGSSGTSPGAQHDSGIPPGRDASVDAQPDSRGDAHASDAQREATAPADAKISDGGAASPRGVYIPTFQKAISSDTLLQQENTKPYVDGFFLSRTWSQIETSPGTYNWTSLDEDIQTVAAAGKKASLAIGAGAQSPPWICNGTTDGGPHAECITLIIQPFSNTTGTTTACNRQLLPLPWDPVFQADFAGMVTALGAHVAGNATWRSTLVLVKVTGINDTTEETILPSQKGGTTTCTSGDACTGGKCAKTDTLAALKAAGYTDASATMALLAFAGDFRAAFTGLPIGSQVSGDLPSPGTDSLPLVLAKAFVGAPSLRPITVQDNGLAATTGVDPGTLFALEAGVPVGYQMLAGVSGDTRCEMGRGLGPDGGTVPCTEAVLIDAINNGIDKGGARWLEIYEADVNAYPDAATYAHSKLVGP